MAALVRLVPIYDTEFSVLMRAPPLTAGIDNVIRVNFGPIYGGSSSCGSSLPPESPEQAMARLEREKRATEARREHDEVEALNRRHGYRVCKLELD